jgi:hypothetical protein
MPVRSVRNKAESVQNASDSAVICKNVLLTAGETEAIDWRLEFIEAWPQAAKALAIFLVPSSEGHVSGDLRKTGVVSE